MTSTPDLTSIVLILESSNPDVLGDLSLFRCLPDAESYLEAIDVRNNEYFGFMLDGRSLTLSAVGERVSIMPNSDEGVHSVRVRRLLEEYFRFCNRDKSLAFSDLSHLPLERLVETIGLTR